MSNQPSILSVSQLNRHVRTLLEFEMGEIRVEGEISNLSKPSSGHFYFTLKDAVAQIRCVYFRNRHNMGFNPIENGQQVIASGKLSLYEARGDFQLIVEQLKKSGLGDLFHRFELLKQKLSALGLFDSNRKKPIPQFAQTIGVITSPTSAAVRDILITLARRYPLADVVIYSSEVQGKSAPLQLIRALAQANHDRRCDVLVLARGGGSIEDLWAFNDEQVAYAIAQSAIPVVCGVGHETDFTIADFVADLRAATPTAAAEAVTPDKLELIAHLQTLQARLTTAISRFIQHKHFLLKHTAKTIASPERLILTHWQTLDYLRSHLHHGIHKKLSLKTYRLSLLTTKIQAQNPARRLLESKKQLHRLTNNLSHQASTILSKNHQVFSTLQTTLQAVSPLATLDRGYAIVTHRNHVVSSSQQVHEGDKIRIRLAKGRLTGKIIEKGE